MASKENTSSFFPTGMELYFAKVRPTAIIPSKKREDAGYDIYADIDQPLAIAPQSTVLVPTGIAAAVSIGYYLQVEERGSTGAKGLKKSAGVIDSGYRGEIFLAMTNASDKTFLLVPEEQISSVKNDDSTVVLSTAKAIAQLIVHRVYPMEVHEISYDELKKIPSQRKEGMLGSSGK